MADWAPYPQLRLEHHARVAALVMLAVIGTFTFNFAVTLPLMIERTLGGTDATYTAVYAVLSVGSLLGALAAWTRRVRLLTTVIVPQLHDPVMLAKALATAGATKAVAGSPMPPGFSVLSTRMARSGRSHRKWSRISVRKSSFWPNFGFCSNSFRRASMSWVIFGMPSVSNTN